MLDGRTNVETFDATNSIIELLPLMLILRLYMVIGAVQGELGVNACKYNSIKVIQSVKVTVLWEEGSKNYIGLHSPYRNNK